MLEKSEGQLKIKWLMSQIVSSWIRVNSGKFRASLNECDKEVITVSIRRRVNAIFV